MSLRDETIEIICASNAPAFSVFLGFDCSLFRIYEGFYDILLYGIYGAWVCKKDLDMIAVIKKRLRLGINFFWPPEGKNKGCIYSFCFRIR